ncbi:hypothetical protein Agub_g568, partial [Astrephomene gubernaculifera]
MRSLRIVRLSSCIGFCVVLAKLLQGSAVAGPTHNQPGFQGAPTPQDHGFFFYGLSNRLPPQLRWSLGLSSPPPTSPAATKRPIRAPTPSTQPVSAGPTYGLQPGFPLQELDWEGACYDAAADGLMAPGGSAGGSSSSSSGQAPTTTTTTAAGVAAEPGSRSRPPVIFLPPLTGTELQGRLDGKPSVPRWWCSRRTSGWF